MKTAWIAALLLAASTPAAAAEWKLVAQDSNEIVFVDRGSIHDAGGIRKTDVLRSFSAVQTIGDDAYPHRSEILRYAVRCEDRSLGVEQWTMTAGEIGTGATIWAGELQEPSLYRDPGDRVESSMVESVCSG